MYIPGVQESGKYGRSYLPKNTNGWALDRHGVSPCAGVETTNEKHGFMFHCLQPRFVTRDGDDQLWLELVPTILSLTIDQYVCAEFAFETSRTLN